MPNSVIGAVEAALKTLIETTSVTTCYHRAVAPAEASSSKPYAVIGPSDGEGVTFDVNSRNRPVWPMPIEVYADKPDMTGTQQVPADLLYQIVEELLPLFDANRATILAIDDQVIDFWIRSVQLSPTGDYALFDCAVEIDYPYA